MWLHLNDNDISFWERNFLHYHRRLWLNVTVRTNSCYILEQIIRNLDATYLTIVRYTKHQVAGQIVSGQIVRHSANGLTELIGVGGRNGALNTVILRVQHQGSYLFVRYHILKSLQRFELQSY